MDLKVEYRCVLEEERGTIGLPLESIKDNNVQGLKIILQGLLGVPSSDISAFLNGTLLVEDKMPLKQLYLRENDTLWVEFNGRGSLATIQQLSADLETFKELTTCHEQQDTIHLSKCNTALINRQSYSQIDIAIIKLCGLFLPWNSSSTTTNKLFFIQQGGADLFIDIFKFSAKDFVDETNRGRGDLCAASVYNNYQLVLMVLCLRLLWTFAETKADGQLMLSKGVEPLVFNALLLDPDSHRYAKGHHGIFKNISNVNQEAIGCLAGLAETDPGVQEHITKNGLVLRKLMLMIKRKGKTAGRLRYPLFTSQLAAASLYFCTFNEYSLEYLVKKGVHYQVMEILQQLLEDISGDVILRFYCVLFLGKIRSSELNCLNNKYDGSVVDCLIESFLGRHKPHEIQSWNEQNSCHWNSLVPCVEMMYAGGKYCMCNESLLLDDASALNYGSSKCDCNNAENEGMHKDTRTKEPLVKHTAYCEAVLCKQMIVSSPSNTTFSCQCMKRLPSALERTHSEMSWPGSHATQRLGLFTLQCLLPIKHNCDVLIKENLLPHVITLGWQLRKPERLALNKALCYVKDVKSTWNPPSLEVIISSVLARRDGFNKVRQHQLSGTLYSRLLK